MIHLVQFKIQLAKVKVSNLSKVVERRVVADDLSDLVESMYSTAFSLAHSGTLGLPGKIPLSGFEPFFKKKDSFLIGRFTNEKTVNI